MALRIDHLNKKIHALTDSDDSRIELIKGDDYFYFIDAAGGTVGEMIMVAKLNDADEDFWIGEAQTRMDEMAEARDDEESYEDDEEVGSKMSSTLVKYRPIYVKSTSANGNASLHNGDEVAELLSHLSPDETCAVADHLFGEFPGTHYEKYARLNQGSRRMNAGNRIRALIRRGEKTIADLEAAIKGDDLIHDEADV